MAFSTAQAASIRLYLGYPEVFRQANPRLEGAITVVGTDTDASALVTGILTQLANVETSIQSTYDGAGIKRADEVEFFGGAEGASVIQQQRQYGRRLCSQLSLIFGVPLGGDAFGEGGYQGDGWALRGSQYGGLMPLG